MNWPFVVVIVMWRPGVSVGVVLVLVIVAIPCTSYLLLIKNHLVQEKKRSKKEENIPGLETCRVSSPLFPSWPPPLSLSLALSLVHVSARAGCRCTKSTKNIRIVKRKE